ncbi:tetratricopeptide repeat protein [bacterium]|nr:tetratricopeptide repeat protein [bacterium]
MTSKKPFFVIIAGLGLIISGCATKTVIVSGPVQSEPDPKAVGLFIDGLNHELNQNYAAALLMYQEATLYDSTSPTIYQNIGKNYLRLGKDESAMLALKRSLELDPGQIEVWDLLASIYARHGWWDLTEKAYLSIMARDSTHIATLHKLALLYLRADKIEAAAAAYERILYLEPVPDPKVLVSLGEIYFNLKKFEKSKQYFQGLVDLHPESGFGYLGLGMTREAEQDTAGAMDNYLRAIEKTASLNEARDRLGQLYIAKEAWGKAIQVYTEAVEIDTTNLERWLELGDLYQQTGDSVQAGNLYQEIQNRFPQEWQAHFQYGRFLMRQRMYGAAFDSFRKVTGLSPENGWGWLFGGFALVHMDSLNSALVYLNRALQYIPDDPMGNYYLGTAYAQLEQYGQAVGPLVTALKKRPDWISAMSALANAHENLGNYLKADSLFQTSLALEPENALLLNNYAYSLSLRGERLEDAMKMAQTAVEKDPENGAYHDTMGWIYFQMGMPVEALSCIETAVRLRKDSYEVYDHLGDVYAALGMPEKARDAWKKALSLDEDNTRIQEKLSQSEPVK